MLMWLRGDRRLFGRWRSDAERTLAEWPFKPDQSDASRERVAGIFGKLEVTYSRWRWRSTFDGQRSHGWYRVLAKDRHSTMIETLANDEVTGWTRTLFHVHFDDECYWITLGNGSVREFFRRVT